MPGTPDLGLRNSHPHLRGTRGRIGLKAQILQQCLIGSHAQIASIFTPLNAIHSFQAIIKAQRTVQVPFPIGALHGLFHKRFTTRSPVRFRHHFKPRPPPLQVFPPAG